MHIFLSYASEYQRDVEPAAIALRNAGHVVFLDKDDLPAGADFNEQIRKAIDLSALFVFFITPESVGEGRFTRSELGFARKKWPGPAGRVLPVMLRPTPIEAVPPYLRAVHILETQGNLAVELQAEVARMGGQRKPSLGSPRLWFAGLGLAAVAAIVVSMLSSSLSETSLTCGYRDGPKSGMVESSSWGQPMTVGAPCIDYLGSTGVFVSAKERATLPDIDKKRFTKRCQFATGPRAGQAAGISMALNFGIGAPCHDGAGSVGTGVPE